MTPVNRGYRLIAKVFKVAKIRLMWKCRLCDRFGCRTKRVSLYVHLHLALVSRKRERRERKQIQCRFRIEIEAADRILYHRSSREFPHSPVTWPKGGEPFCISSKKLVSRLHLSSSVHNTAFTFTRRIGIALFGVLDESRALELCTNAHSFSNHVKGGISIGAAKTHNTKKDGI